MLNLSLNKQKLIAKIRGMKGYERKSENDLIQYFQMNQKQKWAFLKKIGDIKKTILINRDINFPNQK